VETDGRSSAEVEFVSDPLEIGRKK